MSIILWGRGIERNISFGLQQELRELGEGNKCLIGEKVKFQHESAAEALVAHSIMQPLATNSA